MEALPVNPPLSLLNSVDKYHRAKDITKYCQQYYNEVVEIINTPIEINALVDPAELRFRAELKQTHAAAHRALAKATQSEVLVGLEALREGRRFKLLPIEEISDRIRSLRNRYLAAGYDLWTSFKIERRVESPAAARFMPTGADIDECLLSLYKDKIEILRKWPRNCRSDAEDYYLASPEHHGVPRRLGWCHVTGEWQVSNKIAHIVPLYSDLKPFSEIIFGPQCPSLDSANNTLLLSPTIKKWFERHQLVIVPVDPSEWPIRRWRTDIISPEIINQEYTSGLIPEQHLGRELHGKELSFLGKKRPDPSFLYFHFFVSLIRIRDLECHGWQAVWSRYYENNPFPAPSNYLRKSVMVSLACYFKGSDTDLVPVERWFCDQGFDAPYLRIGVEQAKEVARRILDVDEEVVLISERDRVEDEDDL